MSLLETCMTLVLILESKLKIINKSLSMYCIEYKWNI